MLEVMTKLTAGGEIAIPDNMLRALELQVGDEVILRLENGEVRLFTPRQGIKHAQDLVSHYIPEGRFLSDELIAERRRAGEE